MLSTQQLIKSSQAEMPKFKRKQIMEAVTLLLDALGADVNSEGLKGTPDRVARMYEEVFEGMYYTNKEISKMCSKSFEITEDNDDLVVIKDIPIFSYCEHHLALMYNMKVSVGYIPNGRVIGLSKVARIADLVSKRLQLQERIGHDIAEIMKEVCSTKDIIVVVEGEHSCMTARGINKNGSRTTTASVHGRFKNKNELRKEFYDLIKS